MFTHSSHTTKDNGQRLSACCMSNEEGDQSEHSYNNDILKPLPTSDTTQTNTCLFTSSVFAKQLTEKKKKIRAVTIRTGKNEIQENYFLLGGEPNRSSVVLQALNQHIFKQFIISSRMYVCIIITFIPPSYAVLINKNKNKNWKRHRICDMLCMYTVIDTNIVKQTSTLLAICNDATESKQLYTVRR